MLISLILIVYNLTIAFFAGLVFTRLMSKVSSLSYSPLHPAIQVLSGWVFITLQLQLIHLFMPVGLYAHIIVWTTTSLLAIPQWKTIIKDAITSVHFIWSKKHLGFALAFLIIGILNICSRSADGDIGDYHLQAIRWMEEYKVVPGIGNIRRQLGNNSNWFLLNAFSGISFAGLRSIYVLNTSLLIVAGMFVLPQLTQKFWLRNFILFCYFLIITTRKYTGAVTNDLVVTCTIIIIFCWFTDLCSSNQKKPFELLLIIIITIALITYKLSALPMLLFALGIFVLLLKQQVITLRVFTSIMLFSLVLFVPWIITNVYHSGYMAFPLAGTNVFGVDWEMRSEIIDYEKYANLAYARAPMVDIETARYYTFNRWFPLWLKSLDVLSKILLPVNVALLILLTAILIINKKFRNLFLVNHYWLTTTTIIIALFLWFTHGPTTRFVFGYLIFVVAMGTDLLHLSPVTKLFSSHKLKICGTLAAGLLCMFLYQHYTIKTITTIGFIPPAYSQSLPVQLKVDGGILYVPHDKEQCWDACLPCTSLPDSALQYRGKTIADGFRIKK